MRSRFLTILAVLLTAGPALVPTDARAQSPTPAKQRTERVTPAASKKTGPTTHQLGLAPAPFRLYILVTNPDGTAANGLTGTTDPLYAGWCDLYGFGSGGEATVPDQTTFTKPTLTPLTLTRGVDSTTTALFSRLVNRQSSNFTFVIVRDAPDRIETWRVKCTGAYVTDQKFSYEGEGVTESDTIVSSTLEWSYVDTDATGKVLNEIFASYDINTNLPSFGTRSPTYPGGQDANGNGIPDGWEVYYGLHLANPAEALLDFDGDGQNNLQEYLASTLPIDPKSVLRLSVASRVVANGIPMVTLKWTSVANKTYLVQSAGNPGGPWTTVATVASAGDDTTTTTFAGSAQQVRFFYRVSVSP